MVEVTQASKEAAARFWGYTDYKTALELGDGRAIDALAEAMDQRVNEALRSLADDPAMVERVARALCIDDDGNPDDDNGGKPMWRLWIEDAQLVLQAIGGAK